jgi:hypothetical protein
MTKPHKKRRSKHYAMVGAASGGSRLSQVKTAALSEKHTLTAIGAALALGLAKKQGFKLPSLPLMGPAATYGLAAWALSKYTKNNVAAHAATGLLSVAAYEMVSGGGMAGDSSDVMGADEVLGEF